MNDKLIVTVKAEKKYIKAIRPNLIDVFPVFQSKQTGTNNQRYTIVGQLIVQDSPFYTRFDVLDSNGKSTDDETGRQIHKYVAMRQVASYVQLLQAPLEIQKEASHNHVMDDRDGLQIVSEDTVESLRKLVECAADLSTHTIARFEEQWDIFWTDYEARINPLIKRHSNELVQSEDQSMQALLQESDIVYRLFSSLSSSKEPVTTNINDLIEMNYELGRVDQETKSDVNLSAYDRFTHKLLSFLFKGVFWVLVPFVLLIFIIDGFNFSILVFLALIVFVYIPISKQNEARLRMKMMHRLEEHGSKTMADLSRGSNRQVAHSKSSVESINRVDVRETASKSEEAFVADAISLNVGSGSFLVAFCSVFITILFVWSDGWSSSITKFFLYLSLILIAFSIWLPYSKFVKRQVIITNNTVQIGKRFIYAAEVKHVICRADGNMIEFHLTHTKEATQIRMEDEYKLATRDRLKKWCEQLSVPFEEKK